MSSSAEKVERQRAVRVRVIHDELAVALPSPGRERAALADLTDEAGDRTAQFPRRFRRLLLLARLPIRTMLVA